MPSQEELEAMSDWARTALKETEHNETVRIFNDALHVIAFCQRKLKLRQVISILGARGSVTVAILGDASGGRDARYATLDWDSVNQVVHGNIPQPENG
jgi:hypothetical protein